MAKETRYQKMLGSMGLTVLETKSNIERIRENAYAHKEVYNVSLIPIWYTGFKYIMLTEDDMVAIKAPDIEQVIKDIYHTHNGYTKACIKLVAESKMSLDDFLGDYFQMIVLTNETNAYAASLIYHENTYKKLYKKLGAFFVLPSSVHECIIVPLEEEHINRQAGKLYNLVKTNNRIPDLIRKDDIVGDFIYFCKDGKSLQVYTGENIYCQSITHCQGKAAL